MTSYPGQLELVPKPVKKRQPRTVWCSPEDKALFASLTDGDDIENYLGYEREEQQRRALLDR